MNYIKADNPICDYVELHYQDATVTSDFIMSWNIPIAYYSNLNSPVCEVSVVQCSVDKQPNVNSNLKWLGSVQNGFNTRNNGLILGHLIRNFDGGNETKYYLNEASPVKILTPARPQTIKLQLVEPDDTPIDINSSGDGAGYFLLKFDYYDHKQIIASMENSSYLRTI